VKNFDAIFGIGVGAVDPITLPGYAPGNTWGGGSWPHYPSWVCLWKHIGMGAVDPITLPGYAPGNTLRWGQLTPLPFLGMPLETHLAEHFSNTPCISNN